MISILGAGSIGQLLAHKLTEASVDCQLIVRDSQKYSDDEWKITQEGQTSYQKFLISEISDAQHMDTLCVCVKSPELENALNQIKHRISSSTKVILFQNGMGHEKIAQHYVDSENLFFASNTHGVFRSSLQSINYAGKGEIHFGQLELSNNADNQSLPNWFNLFFETTLNCQWQHNITPTLYKKLLVNSIINPLASIYQCKNGDLLLSNKKQRLLSLINENSLYSQMIGLDLGGDSLKNIVIHVLEKTADNFNSMLQDVKAGHITEIESINGYLLSKMQTKDFSAPHSWQLWSDFHIKYPPLQSLAKKRAGDFDSIQYEVTQNSGTESPYTGKYYSHNAQGNYLCACCDSVLFDNEAKFDAHCGWPSFDKAKNNKSIAYRQDSSHNMSRVEILCSQCGSHLGHVFNDGPTETGERYCVNSVSLNFAGK